LYVHIHFVDGVKFTSASDKNIAKMLLVHLRPKVQGVFAATASELKSLLFEERVGKVVELPAASSSASDDL
jgi:hypothetical protein